MRPESHKKVIPNKIEHHNLKRGWICEFLGESSITVLSGSRAVILQLWIFISA